MKAVFLDIDGVLNKAPRGDDTYFDAYAEKNLALDSGCVENLKMIFDAYGDLMAVWSTDWRFYDEPVWYGRWKNPRLYLESLPWMKGRILGKTPRKMSSEHFHDVKWWLDENGAGLDGYVVLDDCYFPKNWFGIERHFVKCDPEQGLTKSAAGRAIKILGGEF